jgi:hypothetical protein
MLRVTRSISHSTNSVPCAGLPAYQAENFRAQFFQVGALVGAVARKIRVRIMIVSANEKTRSAAFRVVTLASHSAPLIPRKARKLIDGSAFRTGADDMARHPGIVSFAPECIGAFDVKQALRGALVRGLGGVLSSDHFAFSGLFGLARLPDRETHFIDLSAGRQAFLDLI